jgi:hypothetical protein
MANVYSQWSEIFEFKTKEAADLFEALSTICCKLDNGELDEPNLDGSDTEDLDEEDMNLVVIWQGLDQKYRKMLLEDFQQGMFECDREGTCKFWVYADEYGNLDGLGSCAHVALAVTEDTETIFTITWAEYCDKLRVGEFGGGWMVIHAGGVEYGNAHDAAWKAAEAIQSTLASEGKVK